MRRPSKPEILVPQRVRYTPAGTADDAVGWVVRISIVGADIEALQPPPVGTQVEVRGVFANVDMVLPARVQWSTQGQFGVQFGALGVRETHAILQAAQSGGIG